MRFLALGDSYTIGEGVGREERWPMQLARLLDAQGIAVETEIIARTGWTTTDLHAGIDELGPSPNYDLVFLLIGVNNQYDGLSLNAYHREFVALLQRAISLAGGSSNHVVVLSIPDWSVTPFAGDRDRARIADEISSFNAVNRSESERLGAHYLDVTPMSREAADDRLLLAEDGLHPSGKMYVRWAEMVMPVVLSALAKP